MRVFNHMPSANSHLSHPEPAYVAERLDDPARAMPPKPKRASAFRGFVIFESDEPLLAALQPNYQDILRLTGSYIEMAQQLQVPPGTVRSRLHRARAALVAMRKKQSAAEELY
jgi:DNA-directed RNA polymerase specialized sigma24 family protein